MNTTRRMTVAAAAFLLALGAVVIARPPEAVAQSYTPVDVNALDMVPVRMWGVADQDPASTQTAWLDVLVWDFAQIGDRMFVGGAFLNVKQSKDANPIAQPYVAAFDTNTGAWISTWRPRLDRAVYALDVAPNGSLLVGGEFESVNGTPRRGLVALDPMTGAIDGSFAGAVDRPWSESRAVVRDIKIVGDDTYVVGNFSHLDGANGGRARVYKAGRFTNAAGSVDGAWKPEATGSSIWGVDVDTARNEVTFAGFFTAVNGEVDSGHFHTVDGVTGAGAPGKIEIPRNQTNQLEFFDVAYGDDLVFAIGEQHITQVLRSDNHQMIGYHHTGASNDVFDYTGGFAGGAYQVGERIGDVIFAGCHCTYSERFDKLVHFSSFTGRRTNHRLIMAYNARTGQLIESFKPEINSPRDGTWAVGSDTNGCLYVGGDFHVGGLESGQNRWLGGFGKFCPSGVGGDGGEEEVVELGPELVTVGNQWRFDDSGVARASGWRSPNFDDASWSIGLGEFGFGDGDETTRWKPGAMTYYARTTFELSGARPNSLALQLAADDGAVVYLNGVELLRDNMPEGEIAAATPPVIWRDGAAEKPRTHLVPSDALVAGTNVLAVEIHNITAANGDVSLDLRLNRSDAQPAVPATTGLIEGATGWANAGSDIDDEPVG